MEKKTKHQEKRERTNQALVAAARKLFAERGFYETATEEIVQIAGVTRGALYYQFQDKGDLFRVVVEQLQAEITAESERAIDEVVRETGDRWQGMLTGARMFLELHLRPDIARILGLEGPAALGVKTYRQISRKHLFGLLLQQVEALKAEGQLPDEPTEALAQMIAGAVRGATLYLLESDHGGENPEVTLRRAIRLMEAALTGLRTDRGVAAAAPAASVPVSA